MQLCVLGPIEVVDGGQPVPLGGAKERTVLAVLAVAAGEVVSDSRLIDALWGDDPPRTANKTLQNYVLRLRKMLHQDGGSGCLRIETAPPGYRLQVAPGALDSHVVGPLRTSARAAMERGDCERASALLAEALACWRGPSLAEFADQVFALAEAVRLDGIREAILEDQIEVSLALGRNDDCISEVEGLITRYPLRERLWGQLMVALYRAGRQADALRAYQRARSTLVEQLGIEPGPALRQLEQAIIDQHPSLDGEVLGRRLPLGTASAAGAAASAAPAAGLPPDLAGADDDLFVGRQGELATLLAAWERACAGQRQAVLLAGEPGIGKTTLARALAWRVHEAGCTVLYGRSDEDLDAPYQPFAEAIRWYAANRPAAALELAGAPAAGLVRLVPELAARLPESADTVRAEPEVERQRLFEAVGALVAAVSAQTPVLIVVDDLHWASTPTLLLLRSVLRATLGARVLVLGTYRDTELRADHPLATTLAALSRDEGVQRLTVCGLAEDEAVELVARQAGHDLGPGAEAFARSLHAETGGNPFFLDQMLRHLVETHSVYVQDGRWTSDHRVDELDLPTGVRDLVGRRLARLSPGSQRAVAVGAIVGPAFSIDLLERVPDAASSSDTLLDALDEAVGAMVVAEVPDAPGRYVFAHALVRQVLLAGLTATRRARLHRRVGEAIEGLPGHEQEHHLGALARHFTEACETSKAVGYSLRAGAQAIERLAFEQAAGYFEGAIAILDRHDQPDLACRADLLIALAEGRALTGDRRAALDALGRAADDARALVSAPRLAHVAMA
ncbi:MAG: BTAD domain-containing putative transcriptional regulator, partial [Acidimicrobiales bacterium]